MIVLGLILLIIGLVASINLLTVIGLILIVVGLVLNLVPIGGTRRFAVEDHSTNVFWLALLSFGESWHHNHHTFPRSAMHGLRAWEVDPTAWLIRGMRRLRLAWNVVEISPERQRQKLSPEAASPA